MCGERRKRNNFQGGCGWKMKKEEGEVDSRNWEFPSFMTEMRTSMKSI